VTKRAWLAGLIGLLAILCIGLFALRQHSEVSGPAPSNGNTQAPVITIATSGTGGAYYPLGAALADIVSKHLPGTQPAVEVTGGSADNVQRIGADGNEIGFSAADVALEAFNGDGRFANGKIGLRTLVVFFPSRLQVVTIEGTGIDKPEDLKGRRVSTGVPGSATEATAFRFLDALGLDRDKDIKRERMSAGEAAGALRERKIDAFFWLGAVPTPSIAELAGSPSIKIKLIDHGEVTAAMNRKFGNIYSAGVIRAGAYPGHDKDAANADLWNLLVADEKLPDEQAYMLVKMIFGHAAELAAARPEAGSLSLERQTSKDAPIPFHPGAIRYFKERGASF